MNLGRRNEEAPGLEGIRVSASHNYPALANGRISECPCQVPHGSLIATVTARQHNLLKEVNQAP